LPGIPVRRVLTALFCAAALAGATGCGESDQEQAREVVQDYVDARADDDFETVCDLYSDEFKEELGAAENCTAFLEEQTGGADPPEAPDELQVVSVRVNDDRGTAEIDVVREGQGPSRIGLLLARDGDDWKISGLQ
jgi:hypothetical protein